MDREWNDWVEDDDDAAPKRRRRDKRGAEVAVDVEDDELTEWRQERGSKGRKPMDERRRPRRRDDEEF